MGVTEALWPREFGTFHDQTMGNSEPISSKFLTQLEINYVLTIFYILVEVGRQKGKPDGEPLIRHAFGMFLEASKLLLLLTILHSEKTESDLLHCLILIAAKFRWDESYIFPLPRVSPSSSGYYVNLLIFG